MFRLRAIGDAATPVLSRSLGLTEVARLSSCAALTSGVYLDFRQVFPF